MACGGTSYWTGGGKDGKWSTPENWDPGVPAKDDTAVLSNGMDQVISICNDAEDVQLGVLMFANSASGRRIDLTGNKISIKAGGKIRLSKDNPSIYTPIDCLGNFSIDGVTDNKSDRASANGTFYGEINCPNTDGTLTVFFGLNVKCYAPIHLGGYTGSYTTGATGGLELCATGNTFRTFHPYYGYMRVGAAYALTPDFVWDWGNYVEKDSAGMCYAGANIQVIDHIGGPLSTDANFNYGPNETGYKHGRQLNGDGATIIQRSKCSVTTEAYLTGTHQIVWDPLDPSYVQSFELRANTMSGTLVVSNGTMKVANEASFANVSTVLVGPGAHFVLDTVAANAMKSLATLTVGRNGSFTVSGACVTPFSKAMTLTLKTGAKLVLGAEQTLTGTVIVNGVRQHKGTYTSANCDWIEGDGSVAATDLAGTSWAAAVNGAWSEDEKWYEGTVPSGSTDVYITAEGADYTVTADGTSYTFPTLTIGNDGGFTTSFLVTNGITFARNNVIAVRAGGAYVQTAGVTTMEADARHPTVETGGSWLLSNCTNTYFSYNSSQQFELRGLLDINDARFEPVNKTASSWVSPFTLSGGKIVVRGKGYFGLNVAGESVLGAGEIEIKDNAEFSDARQSLCEANGKMRITTKDRAYLHFGAAALIGFAQKGYDCRIDMGSAVEGTLGDSAAIAVNYPGYAEVLVREGAKALLGGAYNFYLGSDSQENKAYVTCFPTGVVTIAGTARSSTQYFLNPNVDGSALLRGVEVGGTWHPRASESTKAICTRTQCWPVGTLNVEKTGSYTHGSGFFAVGDGFGEGTVNVRGGSFSATDAGLVMVGAGEGLGRFNVTDGGSATLGKDLYVGSFVTNVTAKWSIPRCWPYWPADALTSTGVVRVVDGALDVKKGATKYDAVFGGHGTGFLEIGSNGVFTAGHLTMSNHVASVLRFTLGADGVGKVSANRMTVAPGAKLVIDATAYTCAKKVTLVEAGAWEGAFADGDVTVIPADYHHSLTLSANGKLRFGPQSGMVLIVR